MSDMTREFLHRVFRAIPEEQRVAFLREVLETLEQQQRETLLAAPKSQEKPEISAPEGLPLEKTSAARVMPNKPSDFAASPPLQGVRDGDTLHGDKEAIIEDHFKKFAVQEGVANDRKSLRGQLFACLGLVALGIAASVGLYAGGSALWKWLVAMFP